MTAYSYDALPQQRPETPSIDMTALAHVCTHLGRVMAAHELTDTLQEVADNATAAAFQTHTTCVVDGNGIDNGAVAAPLLTPTGCAGVLALELRNKTERREDVRAAVTIIAAQVSTLVGASMRVPQSMTA
jgi:hypothetical protein